VPGLGYQPEQQGDQRPIGPGDIRSGMLANLALQNGELVLQQQDLGSAPGSIPEREPDSWEQAGSE